MIEKEQKELLLKDLCGRLPYGVKCAYFDMYGNEEEGTLEAVFPNEERLLVGKCSIDYSDSDILGVVPYLFPLSSMTKEQIKEFNGITQRCNTYTGKSTLLTDFCNKHHIDIRGLINIGLAIDCTNLNIY